MPYVLSKLANTQVYTQYAKDVTNNINIVKEQVTIKGGADVTTKNLITPDGVVTQVTRDQLEILKANRDFQRHLETGHVKYFEFEPKIDKEVDKMEKDNSKPLTPDDYKKKGKKAPKTELVEDE